MLTHSTARTRWNHLFTSWTSLNDVKHYPRGPEHPCLSGLRSLCWKIYVLYPDFTPSAWISNLREHRLHFEQLSSRHLSLINGDGLGIPDIDPLADDEENPWEQYRRDVELRQEIIQDVERCMPENTFFRRSEVQSWLVDVLMVWCKEDKACGNHLGYRQGLHELAAILLWVVWCDSIDPASGPGHPEGESANDGLLDEVLDPAYVSHDTFILFSAVMKHAKEWYEPGPEGHNGISPIIQRSKYIHETLLKATDPELATHLKTLDVLPQVFLIRWIRLLFSREFPLDELLLVWDALFAEDKEFHLVDLICVSMLLRIRWQLLEADYSTALTLVLRYPEPSSTSPPVTFVDDAVYLRDNLSIEGGRHIIEKYSNRTPSVQDIRQPSKDARSRALSPAKSWTPGSQLVETVVQDIAKNVIDRSQRWGVNRALREPTVEGRKGISYQTLQKSPAPAMEVVAEQEELVRQNALLIKRIVAGEDRQRQLARILEMGINGMKSGQIEEAERRLLHVKECLLDGDKALQKDYLQKLVPSAPTSPEVVVHIEGRQPEDVLPGTAAKQKTPPRPRISHRRIPSSPGTSFVKPAFKNNSDTDFMTRSERPRATLAQSSFAWMLGDDPAEKNRSGFIPKSRNEKAVAGNSRDEAGKGDLKEPEEVDLAPL